MLPEEVLKKVKLIEIKTKKAVDDMMSGQYKSHFRGLGVQFSEHRQYTPGDDVRHIDWKVSARTRDPLIKKFDEERELSVFLVVDVSHSKSFGSQSRLKGEVAAELAGMLAYAAIHTGDKVGMLLFAGEVEKIIRPAKGKQHVLRIIRELLTYEGKTSGTRLADALDATGRMMKHSGVIFVISDFLSTDYDLSFKRLAKRHDVVAIQIEDEGEREPGIKGKISVVDPETGRTMVIDTSSYRFQEWMKQFRSAHLSELKRLTSSSGVELLKVSTHEDYIDAVVRFFRSREKRAR